MAQLIKKGQFIQFEYAGFWTNFWRYGSLSIPTINLQKVPTNIPIALLVGKQDPLANKVDVDRLASEMGSRITMHKEYDNFDHYGFAVGKDMSWTNDVLNLLKQVGGEQQ